MPTAGSGISKKYMIAMSNLVDWRLQGIGVDVLL